MKRFAEDIQPRRIVNKNRGERPENIAAVCHLHQRQCRAGVGGFLRRGGKAEFAQQAREGSQIVQQARAVRRADDKVCGYR